MFFVFNTIFSHSDTKFFVFNTKFIIFTHAAPAAPGFRLTLCSFFLPSTPSSPAPENDSKKSVLQTDDNVLQVKVSGITICCAIETAGLAIVAAGESARQYCTLVQYCT